MSPSEHDRTCTPISPVIEQAEAVWDSMVQSTPVSAGSASFTVTPVAIPGPPLDTVIVNPTASPAVTDVASAVLLMVRLGSSGTTCGPPQFLVQGGAVTTMMAKAWTEPPLVDVAVAVLGSEPCVAAVVGVVMWIV